MSHTEVQFSLNSSPRSLQQKVRICNGQSANTLYEGELATTGQKENESSQMSFDDDRFSGFCSLTLHLCFYRYVYHVLFFVAVLPPVAEPFVTIFRLLFYTNTRLKLFCYSVFLIRYGS